MKVAAAIAAVLVAACAHAETRISDKLQFLRLDNGVHVFIYPRHNVPVFTGMIYVEAGGTEEQAGETGIAHVLEHMAFKGTPWIGTTDWEAEQPILVELEKIGEQLSQEINAPRPDENKVRELQQRLGELQKQHAQYIVPNEYDQIVTHAGGQDVNATTDNDYTNYFLTLPSNKLELWAMLESQRLLYPAWREFYLERDVVAEERRMRYEDSPSGKLYETFITTAFNAHPYRNPVIGWMSDIQSLTIKVTHEYYKKWYVPENLIILLVGDIKMEQAKPILDKYFGTIPASSSPPRNVTKEPPQQGERRAQVVFDAQPEMFIGWHKPNFTDKDAYVFEVIQYLLTQTGRSSRLYERLVKEESVVSAIESFTAPCDKHPNLFCIYASPRAPHGPRQVETLLLQEIDRLKREPVGQEELTKIRNQIDAAFLRELESNLGLARKLGYYYIATKDPHILDKMRDAMKAVTAEDIMRVAQQYLNRQNMTIAEIATRPRSSDPASAATARPDAPTTATKAGAN